jgi:hypothetical protein
MTIWKNQLANRVIRVFLDVPSSQFNKIQTDENNVIKALRQKSQNLPLNPPRGTLRVC